MPSSPSRPPAAAEVSDAEMADGKVAPRHAAEAVGGGAANHAAPSSDGEEDEEMYDEEESSDDSDYSYYEESDDSFWDDEDGEQEEEEGASGGRVSGSAEEEAAAAGVGGGAEAEGSPRAVATSCICMDPWASYGAHRICCIPCGHVYGRSCLERWLLRCGNASAKCPQCGERFKHGHIINLYSTVHLWNDCCHKEGTAELLDKVRQVCKNQLQQYALHVEKLLKDRFAQLKECMEQILSNRSMSQTNVMSFMLQNWPEPHLQ